MSITFEPATGSQWQEQKQYVPKTDKGLDMGTICVLNGKETQRWVLAWYCRKTIKGISREKKFVLLRPNYNFAIETKPFTHAREKLAKKAKFHTLTDSEKEDFFNYKKQNFEIWLN